MAKVFKPLMSNVLIKMIPRDLGEKKTESGLVYELGQKKGNQESSEEAIILDYGMTAFDDFPTGEALNVGDKVLIQRFSGKRIVLDDTLEYHETDLRIIADTGILAKIEEK